LRCEECQSREATIRSTELRGGRAVTQMLCGVCAGERSEHEAVSKALNLAGRMVSTEDVLNVIDSMEDGDFVGGHFSRRIKEAGLDAILPLMRRLERATSDPDWVPRFPSEEEPSPRFFIQHCVKQILRADYLARNPEYKYVAWGERDHTPELLEWWRTEGEGLQRGETYELPRCLEAVPK